jgi:hypothetical protein
VLERPEVVWNTLILWGVLEHGKPDGQESNPANINLT